MSLVGDECVAWHWHTEISDIFFILEGAAVIETHNPGNAVHVNVGERFDVLPGVPHRVTPLDGKKCRLILVQGVGKADFHLGRP
jgi:mannose-6-phosphate isomerase-like protein (cupin superfamily)